MTIAVRHNFTSQVADSATNGLIKPSHWNDTHSLSMDTGKLLGRTTAGEGQVEEITVSGGLALAAGSLYIADSGVDAGTYLNPAVTVDAKGRITFIENGSSVGLLGPLMAKSVYDPNDIEGDAFDMDNMIEGSDTKILTAAERSKLAGIEALADVTDAGNVGSSIHGATGKTTPVDADTLPLIDSAASNVLKKVTWANTKSTLKTYLDTLYQPLASTLTSWASVTRATGFDTFVATPSSDNLRSLLSDETGTGSAVFATSPTLVTPDIGAATADFISVDAGLTQFDGALWSLAKGMRIGADLDEVGDENEGSANEWGMCIAVNTPAATNSEVRTYKVGLLSIAATSDPADLGSGLFRMSVGVDARGYAMAGNMAANIWGLFGGAYFFDGSDGYGCAAELEVNNFGTAQPLVNEHTSKYVIHAVAGGDAATTAGLKFSSGEFFTNQFYYGIHGFAADYITAFIHLDGAHAVLPTGAGGFGTDDPQRMIHGWVADAVTNSVSGGFRLTHKSSGTVAAGFGVSMEFELENSSGVDLIAATENVSLDVATNGAEYSRYQLNLVANGALVAPMTVSALGLLTVTEGFRSLNTVATATTTGLTLEKDRASPAAFDGIDIDWKLSDDAGNQDTFARLRVQSNIITSTSEVGRAILSLMQSGTLTDEYFFQTNAFYPGSNDGNSLGTSSNGFSDLFLASGGEIRVNNAQVLDTVGGLSTQTATAAAIAAIGNAINTTNKRAGKMVFDTTNNRLVVALGPNAGDAWAVADGSLGITPS